MISDPDVEKCSFHGTPYPNRLHVESRFFSSIGAQCARIAKWKEQRFYLDIFAHFFEEVGFEIPDLVMPHVHIPPELAIQCMVH